VKSFVVVGQRQCEQGNGVAHDQRNDDEHDDEHDDGKGNGQPSWARHKDDKARAKGRQGSAASLR
jgi:hypothetical protein